MIARGRRRLGVPILAAALAGSVLAGACSSSGTLPPASAVATPTPTPTTAAASPPGAAVVHIDLPEDWQEVEITEEALQAQADLLPSDSPMAESLRQLLASGAMDRMLFYALGYDGTTVVGNINVVPIELGSVKLDAVVPVLEGQFKQLGMTDVEHQTATILGAESIVFSYKLSMPTVGGTVNTQGRSYLVPRGGTIYDASVSCFGPDYATCLFEGDAMVKGMTVDR